MVPCLWCTGIQFLVPVFVLPWLHSKKNVSMIFCLKETIYLSKWYLIKRASTYCSMGMWRFWCCIFLWSYSKDSIFPCDYRYPGPFICSHAASLQYILCCYVFVLLEYKNRVIMLFNDNVPVPYYCKPLLPCKV